MSKPIEKAITRYPLKMKYFIKRAINRVVLNSALALIVSLLIAISTHGQEVPQSKPVSLAEIRDALAETKAGLPTANRIWITYIEERGVDFEANADRQDTTEPEQCAIVLAVRESL